MAYSLTPGGSGDVSRAVAAGVSALLRIFNDSEFRTGSGFVVNGNGLAVTNAHVVGNADRVLAVTPEEDACLAPVLHTDHSRDLAVIRVMPAPGKTLQPATLGHSTHTRPGQTVVALGYPPTLGQAIGQYYTVTKGIISGHRHYNGQDCLQTDADINPGNSGGPLLDEAGMVIGVNTESLVQTGAGYAIAADALRDWLNNSVSTITAKRERPIAARAWIETDPNNPHNILYRYEAFIPGSPGLRGLPFLKLKPAGQQQIRRNPPPQQPATLPATHQHTAAAYTTAATSTPPPRGSKAVAIALGMLTPVLGLAAAIAATCN